MDALYDPLLYLAMALGLWALGPKRDRFTLGRTFLIVVGLIWLLADMLRLA